MKPCSHFLGLAILPLLAACASGPTADPRVKQAPAGLPEICARGVGAACAQLAARSRGKEAEKFHQMACEFGVPSSCLAEAGILEATGDSAQAIVFDRRACDGGIAGGCTDAGRLLQAAGAGAAEVAASYEKGCDAGDPASCWNLALALRGGPDAGDSGERIRTLAERACQGDLGTACLFAGEEALKADPTHAAELFKRACDHGDQDGCALAAARTPAEAARLRVHLDCQAGDPTSCYNDALGLEKRDAKAAAELYEKTCPAVTLACTNLGALYQHGSGVTKDPRRARALYRQACDAGEPIACENHGEMSVGEHDLKGALADFKRACDAGERAACKRRSEVAEWKH
jgi:uncharacterized protein